MPHSSGLQKASRGERGLRPPLRVGVILAEHFTLSAFAVFIDERHIAQIDHLAQLRRVLTAPRAAIAFKAREVVKDIVLGRGEDDEDE